MSIQWDMELYRRDNQSLLIILMECYQVPSMGRNINLNIQASLAVCTLLFPCCCLHSDSDKMLYRV